MIRCEPSDGYARIWESWTFDQALIAVEERFEERTFSATECVQYSIEPCTADQ